MSTRSDAVPFASIAPSAGAKAAPGPTLYERETEGDTPWVGNINEEIADMNHEHEDDDLLAEHPNVHGHKGEEMNGHPSLRGGARGAEVGTNHDEDGDGDDDEDLLDGEDLPKTVAPTSDPPVHSTGAKGVKDPEPTTPAGELEGYEH